MFFINSSEFAGLNTYMVFDITSLFLQEKKVKKNNMKKTYLIKPLLNLNPCWKLNV